MVVVSLAGHGRSQVQVFALLVGQVPSHPVAMLVKERGIDFDVEDDYHGWRRHSL